MHPTSAVGALSPTPRACVERIGKTVRPGPVGQRELEDAMTS